MNDVVTGIVASGVFAGIVSIVTCIFMIVFRKPFARDAGASRNLVIVRSPPCAGRRGRLVKTRTGPVPESVAASAAPFAGGRRRRREVARMDTRSQNEQVKRGFAPTRPGGRVPTLHLTRIACPSATCPFVVLVRWDPR